jgi:hypothetical protein
VNEDQRWHLKGGGGEDVARRPEVRPDAKKLNRICIIIVTCQPKKRLSRCNDAIAISLLIALTPPPTESHTVIITWIIPATRVLG